MIKVSVFYPNQEGARFDIDYYCDRHMPLVQSRIGTACKGIAVEHGLAGATPGSKPQFLAMGHIYFDSVTAFQTAFAAHSAEFRADVPNYTDIQPNIQISEVVIAGERAATA